MAVVGFGLAVAWLLGSGAIWNPVAENAARAVACLLAATLLAWATIETRSAPAARRALLAAALLGLAAFYNFGAVRHFTDTRFVNLWEQFHYQLGSKYFPELGYDGLYVASLAAEHEQRGATAVPALVRDLRTNRLKPEASLLLHAAEVRGRFSSERWRAFAADHAHFVSESREGFLAGVRRDHGYNPPPSWTAVARIFSARLPASDPGLTLLATLDILWMGVAFAVAYRTFGLPAAAAALALFGLAHGWRYLYVGAFQRLDWLAAVVIGLCQIERRRFGWAGFCIGYAAAVRLFPALLLFGLAVHGARDLVRGERPRWALRFASTFALAVILLAAAGCFAGRGPAAWSEFARDIRLHASTWAPTRVGLTNVLVNAPALAAWPTARAEALREWPNPPRKVEEWSREHRVLRGVAAAAGLALLAFAAWHAPLRESFPLGLGAVFVAIPLGSYYWIMLAVLPLCRGARAAIPVLALSAGVFTADALGAPLPLSHALMSVGLFVALLAPVAPAVRKRLTA